MKVYTTMYNSLNLPWNTSIFIFPWVNPLFCYLPYTLHATKYLSFELVVGNSPCCMILWQYESEGEMKSVLRHSASIWFRSHSHLWTATMYPAILWKVECIVCLLVVAWSIQGWTVFPMQCILCVDYTVQHKCCFVWLHKEEGTYASACNILRLLKRRALW